MNEKIVEKLSSIFRIVESDEDLEWNRAIDKAISIVQESNDWISVNDRLPTERDWYLAVFMDKKN